jgi:hypothetical protein
MTYGKDWHSERLQAIDLGLAHPIHQGEYERLRDAMANLTTNRRRHPAGLPGPERCYCPRYEQHDGRCLGAECYCH